ncbi:MAG: hypothetical protein JO175_08305 [Candidatus Eremiobacteraeota bacterium]|nr:hypothetical protein [Candidatus Eremiobacteraeota bacterium]
MKRLAFRSLAATGCALLLAATAASAALPSYEFGSSGGTLTLTMNVPGGGIIVEQEQTEPNACTPQGVSAPCIAFQLGNPCGPSPSAGSCKVTAVNQGNIPTFAAICPMSGISHIALVQSAVADGGYITVDMKGQCPSASISVLGKSAGAAIAVDACVGSVTCTGPMPGDGITANAAVQIRGCTLVTRQ